MKQPEKITPQIPPAPAIVAPDEAGAAFRVLEASLPEQLGVARDLIRAIRQHQLAEGVDWVKRHKDILLTSEAVEKIGRALALIGGKETEKAAPGQESKEQEQVQEQEPAPVVKVEVFQVLRSVFKNTFMVSAFDPKEPKRIVWVRVKDNSKWAPGMTIHATHLQHDQYVLHGNNPRWRGKV